MKDYPKKVCQDLTVTCIQIEEAYSAEEMAPIVLAESRFRTSGYEYPEWLNTMIKWKLDKPILSTEEYFRKYFEKSLQKEVLRDIYHIIFKIYDEIREQPFHQVLYAIAAEILIYNPESSLAFEWHCKSDDFQHANGSNNIELFKHILIRESAFWQQNLRSKSFRMNAGGFPFAPQGQPL